MELGFTPPIETSPAESGMSILISKYNRDKTLSPNGVTGSSGQGEWTGTSHVDRRFSYHPSGLMTSLLLEAYG